MPCPKTASQNSSHVTTTTSNFQVNMNLNLSTTSQVNSRMTQSGNHLDHHSKNFPHSTSQNSEFDDFVQFPSTLVLPTSNSKGSFNGSSSGKKQKFKALKNVTGKVSRNNTRRYSCAANEQTRNLSGSSILSKSSVGSSKYLSQKLSLHKPHTHIPQTSTESKTVKLIRKISNSSFNSCRRTCSRISSED